MLKLIDLLFIKLVIAFISIGGIIKNYFMIFIL